MPISKPFVVATEGPTIDGRNIGRDWIKDMAAHYDTKVYTAVINLEHYLSAAPDSIFSTYGKVLSLSTQEADILGEKKLQLMAVADVPQAVVDLQKAGKKAFASIEPKLNFIGKGISYLTGLGLTDRPASVGTESMKFSAFSTGDKESVYSFSHEIEMEFEDAEQQQTQGTSLLSRVKEMLSFKGKGDEARFADIGQAVEAIALSQKEQIELLSSVPLKELREESAAFRKQMDELKTQTEKDRAELAKIKAEVDKLSAQPDGQVQRPAASGGSGVIKSDC